MNNKAQFNLLAIALAIVLLAVGILSIIDEPQITGAATLSTSVKASQEIMDKVENNGTVSVIIFLNEEEELKDKQKIKEKQDTVLSNLDYIDIRDESKIDKFVKSKDFALKYKYSTINAIAGNITLKGLEKLEKDSNVFAIALTTKVTTLLTNSVPQIEADQVWALNLNGRNITGKGQSICIIDTGVDYTHADLGGCTLVNVSEHSCKVIAGYDFVNDDEDPVDDHNHGTHVAGIAAANGSVIGVAKDANIVAIKSLGSGGSGSDADVIAGIDWCANNATTFNISVISMSLGDEKNHTAATCPTAMDAAIQAAIAKGITVLAASGNEASSLGINYPACSPYTIAVGSVDSSDDMASHTNTHDLLDVLAPGVSIVSTKRGGGTQISTGTSMSTPHAAGAAALMYQYEKELNNRNATHEEIKALLKRSNVTASDSGLSFPRVNALLSTKEILYLNTTENSVFGNDVKVLFLSSTNIENMTEAFVFDTRAVSLNSSLYALYNQSANITFYNLTYNKTPVILKDGSVCSDCAISDYTGGILLFNVTQFTNYTTSVNSELDIYDQLDSKGGSVDSIINNLISFYANYSNLTSDEEISAANCSVDFTDENANMTFNSTTSLFVYNRTFLTAQTYNYNVSCSHYNFESLNATDSIIVSDSCLNQTSNANITINAGQTINCTGEIITLKNESINIYGNLILNNSYLFLESTNKDYGNITLYNQSNITVINSTLNSSINLTAIIAHNSSKAELNTTKLINVDLSLSGSSINQIFNSNVNRTFFLGSSDTEVRNSNITGIKQLGGTAVVLNFTINSNVSEIIEIIDNSTIDGYVELPEGVTTYTTIGVKRYYPVEANFTDNKPAIAQSVNITNASNSIEIQTGTTDSDGRITINITFDNVNSLYNYSVDIDSKQNISLLTDSPIVFTLTDATVPAISSVATSGISTSAATITWTTDDYSNTSVDYGTSLSLGNNSQTDDYVVNHSRGLSSLSASTTYYYNVTSCASAGCNSSGGHSFITSSVGGSGGGGGGGGGGSGITPKCETSWRCDLWSKCVNGFQSRICEDIYSCVEIKTETQECEIVQVVEPIVETKKQVVEQSKPVEVKEEAYTVKILKKFYLVTIASILAAILFVIILKRKVFRKKNIPAGGFNLLSNMQNELVLIPKNMRMDKVADELGHEEALRRYRAAFEKYLSMNTEQRANFEQELAEMKRQVMDEGLNR